MQQLATKLNQCNQCITDLGIYFNVVQLDNKLKLAKLGKNFNIRYVTLKEILTLPSCSGQIGQTLLP